MYNPELEGLIDAALADGVLTEKEKQILFKKAQSMGIDLDEFEMVLDARLVKMKKAEEEKAASSAPKSNKLGDVKKCPACGAMVQSYQGACPECGYAFENIDANSSTKRLAEIVDKVMRENNNLIQRQGMTGADLEKEKKQRIINAIQNFAVPTTKSDLFEFITSLQSKTSGNYGKAYKAKLEECILKAKTLFPNDKMFADLVGKYEKQKADKKARKKKFLLIGIPSIVVVTALLIIVLYYIVIANRVYTWSSVLKEKVAELVLNGNTEKAEEYVMAFTGYTGNWEFLDACKMIIQFYVDKGEIEKATTSYKQFVAKEDYFEIQYAEPLVKYYIDQKKYLEAEKFYPQKKRDGEPAYEEFVKEVAFAMAKDGEKAEAKKFYNARKHTFYNKSAEKDK